MNKGPQPDDEVYDREGRLGICVGVGTVSKKGEPLVHVLVTSAVPRRVDILRVKDVEWERYDPQEHGP